MICPCETASDLCLRFRRVTHRFGRLEREKQLRMNVARNFRHCLTSESFAFLAALFLAWVAPLGSVSGQETGTTEEPPPLATQGPKPAAITSLPNEEILASIERGVEFLVQSQRENGAWGSAESQRYYGITAPIPGAHEAFRTAVTSLAIAALIESAGQFEGERREVVQTAIEKGQDWLLEHGDELRRAAPDANGQRRDSHLHRRTFTLYSVWGHAYAIHALALLHHRAEGDEKLQAKLKSLIEYQVDRLRRCAFLNGGWGYYDMVARTKTPSGSPISFTTATVLITLQEAAELGVEFPAELTQKALDSILRQRYPDFSYAYGEYLRFYPRMDINRPGGSLGRSQVCNLAMRMYGDPLVTDEVLTNWLNRLIARNGWLSMSRKRHIPGESPHFADFGVAGYFYYYGHYYAAMCVEELPESERPFYQDHLAAIIVPLQEKDGSWWDFLLYDYHQAAGTGMAVSTLVRTLHE